MEHPLSSVRDSGIWAGENADLVGLPEESVKLGLRNVLKTLQPLKKC